MYAAGAISQSHNVRAEPALIDYLVGSNCITNFHYTEGNGWLSKKFIFGLQWCTRKIVHVFSATCSARSSCGLALPRTGASMSRAAWPQVPRWDPNFSGTHAQSYGLGGQVLLLVRGAVRAS